MKTKPGYSEDWGFYDLAPSDLMVNTYSFASTGKISIMWEGKAGEKDLSAFFQKATIGIVGLNAAVTIHALTNGPDGERALATSTQRGMIDATSHFAGADFLRYDANSHHSLSEADITLTANRDNGQQEIFLKASNLPKVEEALADLIANTSITAATQQTGYDRAAVLTQLRRIACDFAVNAVDRA